jgi:glycosyltransferase involved in cell wall biosynthesis
MFIERCVQSVVDQMGADDEVILVDDGSTDNSGQLCDWFNKCYGDSVKVVHQENKGLSEARNTGIREASGEYAVFLDSDDWLIRGALAQARAILTQRRADVLIGKFRAYHMPPKDSVINDPTDFVKQLGGDELDTEKVRRGIFENNMVFTAWRNIVSLDFIKRNALMFEPGILHEDEEWCPRLFTAARSFAFNPRPFYAYRLREGSIVYTKSWRKTLGLFAAAQTVSGLMKQYRELGAGLARKYSELAGRALQTLPQFDDENRALLFEALPRYPAVSRYILLLKSKLDKQTIADAAGETERPLDMSVMASDDGDMLAKLAIEAYQTMTRGAREAAVRRAAAPDRQAGRAGVSAMPNRRALIESMERMMRQARVPSLSNAQPAPGADGSPRLNARDNTRPASAPQSEPNLSGSPACN